MDDSVTVTFDDGSIEVRCLCLVGEEQVGAASRFWVDVSSDEPVLPAQVLSKWAFIEVQTGVARRGIAGIVTEFKRVAASLNVTNRRRYRVQIEASVARLRLTRRSRVFQEMTIPDIVHQVLVDGGIAPDHIQMDITGDHPQQRYVVQYDETDEQFVRRLCERGGLYYHFVDLGEASETLEEGIVVADDSLHLEPDLDLDLVHESNLEGSTPFARKFALGGRLRTGKTILRDYDHERPSLLLEGEAEAGSDLEKALSYFQAPAGFGEEAEGKALAQKRLEAQRMDARTVRFESNQVLLAPGRCFDLVPHDMQPMVSVEGAHVVVSARHFWKFEEGYRFAVQAVPLDTPVRLEHRSAAPRIAGIHSAWVTGPDGEEIYPDEFGRVRIRFSWDVLGPKNEHSSLPVRVAQANTPHSMAFPRMGWEVFVAFEEGDPERPFVLGRCYNAKQPPPYELPANKNCTTIRSFSSPGGGGMNSIEFNDSSGGQSLAINAGFGLTTTVGNNNSIQVDNVEEHNVGGAQTVTIGGAEDVNVKQTYKVSVADQTATVGGSQDLSVKGKFSVKVGTEVVCIGGALMEQIGSPAAIAMSLASAAVVAGAKSKLADKWLKGKGPAIAEAFQQGKGLYSAYQQGGLEGVKNAGIEMGLNKLAGQVPGGDAVLLAAKEKGLGGSYPWEPKQGQAKGTGGRMGPKVTGPSAGAGGAGAAQSDGAGAAAGGAGDKQHKVDGDALEVVGAAHAIATPASIDWETAGGRADLVVGGVHNTKCGNATLEVLGAAGTIASSHVVNSDGELSRTAKLSCKMTTGPLTIDAKGDLTFAAKDIKITVGDLNLKGKTVTFKCGGSTVSFSSAGMTIKTSTLKQKKATKQSGDVKH